MKSVCLFVSFAHPLSLRVSCHRFVSTAPSRRSLSSSLPRRPASSSRILLLPCLLLSSPAIFSSSCFCIFSRLLPPSFASFLVERDLLRYDVDGKLRDTSSVTFRVSVIARKLCDKRFGVAPLFQVNSTFSRDICACSTTQFRVILRLERVEQTKLPR